MLFEEVFKNYLSFVAERQKKQSSESLKYNFNSKILPYFKNKKIEEITKADIMNWQTKIFAFNYSNNYNRNLHCMLTSFLDFCCDMYNLENNVAREIGYFKKKYERKSTDFYTLKEFKKFIKHVHNNIYKQFFNTMFYAGTRPGEAMALKFSDLQGSYLSINKTIHNHGDRELDTPKTISSIRKVKIDYFLKRDLLRLKKYYCKKYNDYNYDYFIFGGKAPLAPTTINRYKKKACLEAHIREITLHQYRHSHATLLLQRGMLINEISRRLGHSKVSTTLDIYTHTDLRQEKRVVRTLNSLRFDIFRL